MGSSPSSSSYCDSCGKQSCDGHATDYNSVANSYCSTCGSSTTWGECKNCRQREKEAAREAERDRDERRRQYVDHELTTGCSEKELKDQQFMEARKKRLEREAENYHR